MAEENANVVEAKKSNGLAIAGFVVSLVSLLLLPGLGIVGLILSIIGLTKVKVINSGKGLSIAGIIISAIAIVWFIVSLFFLTSVWSNITKEVNNQWQDIENTDY